MSVPAQHKALVVETPQAPFVVKTVDVQHPGPGEVLVKIEATALNPADWKFHTGAFIQKYPTVFGFDAAGTIAELGEGVTSFAVGDRVCVHISLGLMLEADVIRIALWRDGRSSLRRWRTVLSGNISLLLLGPLER